jgi:hypothetical protein
MFGWLFGKKKAVIHVQSTEVESVPAKFPTRQQKPRVVEFVEGLAAAKKPQIFEQWILNYIYEFTLDFSDVVITTEYDTIRHQWMVRIWSREATSFLFMHDAFRAQTFLIETYKLNDLLNAAYDEKRKQKKDENERVEKVIQKYIR